MLTDTNGDDIVDFIAGKVVVPAHPSAAENAAAADLAARLGYATTGFTPPVVISAADDRADGPRIYVGSRRGAATLLGRGCREHESPAHPAKAASSLWRTT